MAVALDFSSFLYSGTKYPMRFYFILLHLSGEKRAILERISEFNILLNCIIIHTIRLQALMYLYMGIFPNKL